MILSIGMIVKNEEKYLRMCLEGLKPVLDGIDAELIIADTGSTDRTVEIAKEFTDKVYYFEWCNDYSKARNTTIKRAVGEWYMFVDADEVLQNPEEIIDFFKSGAYKGYEGATIVIRNCDESSYSDFNALRLTRRTRDVKFYYPIHEGLYPVGEKRKNLNAVFLHYGYVTGRAHTKKNKRYIKNIRNVVEQDPYDIRMISHLVDAYGSAGDNYHAAKYALDAIKICRRQDYDICVLYEKVIRTFNNARDYFQLINTAEKYFRLYKKNVVTNLNIYNYMIYAYFSLKKYEKAAEYFKKYDELRNKILNEGFVTSDISSVVLEISDKQYMQNLIILCNSYINLNDTAAAEKTIDKLYMMNINDENILNNIFTCAYNIYIKTKSEDGINRLFQYIKKFGRVNLLYSFLCRQNFDRNNNLFDVFRILYEHCGDDEFTFVLGIYYMDKQGEYEKIRECLKERENYIRLFPELIYFFIKYDIPLEENIKREICINSAVSEVLYKYDDVCEVLLKGIDTEKNNLFLMFLCEMIFAFHSKASDDLLKNCSRIYYKAVCGIIDGQINKEVLENCLYAADSITRFRYIFTKLYDAKKKNDYNAVKEIKEQTEDLHIIYNDFINRFF